jgi:hypothetical protein
MAAHVDQHRVTALRLTQHVFDGVPDVVRPDVTDQVGHPVALLAQGADELARFVLDEAERLDLAVPIL